MKVGLEDAWWVRRVFEETAKENNWAQKHQRSAMSDGVSSMTVAGVGQRKFELAAMV